METRLEVDKPVKILLDQPRKKKRLWWISVRGGDGEKQADLGTILEAMSAADNLDVDSEVKRGTKDDSQGARFNSG